MIPQTFSRRLEEYPERGQLNNSKLELAALFFDRCGMLLERPCIAA